MHSTIRRSLTFLVAVCMGMLLFPVNAPAGIGNSFDSEVATTLDGAALPVRDPSLASRLPLTGYFEKSFVVGSTTRTAKIYIAAQAPIRTYFTVIAVPDGYTTEQFLRKSGWKDIADQAQEGLFILEPGSGGWGSATDESGYITAAMNFYIANGYFSIFGEHYLVGYGAGAPPLEAWAAANPLKVISQVYVDSKGLPASHFVQYYTKVFDGTTAGYTTVVFPEGFRLLTYAETVLPTWYINPEGTISDSLTYWKDANDCVDRSQKDRVLGHLCVQAADSERWMTSYSGPISKVAVLDRPISYWNTKTTGDIREFLTYYTRYENFFAYGNQLVVRADYAKLGIEIHTMTVNGFAREYMVYVPASAKKNWGSAAPVMWVWAGNSQTDKVFLDATQWWKIAQEEGFILVFPSEKINANAVSVSHGDSIAFFQQLRQVILRDYPVDETRFYFTGQSAGSMLSQSWAVAFPEYFAAVASTSGTPMGFTNSGTVRFEGTNYPAANKLIPNYMIYGYGDLAGLKGDLWDGLTNDLDYWAAYMLAANGSSLAAVDNSVAVTSGWYDRFNTWTWSRQFGTQEVPLFKVTKNVFRSHNCIYEEMPMLWDFAQRYSSEVDSSGSVTRYYSPSGFKAHGDKVRIDP